jgi:hypothetical protein
MLPILSLHWGSEDAQVIEHDVDFGHLQPGLTQVLAFVDSTLFGV